MRRKKCGPLVDLYAGDQYGMVLLPEIGDEVIVAFIGND